MSYTPIYVLLNVPRNVPLKRLEQIFDLFKNDTHDYNIEVGKVV